jgi:hypothetical protein
MPQRLEHGSTSQHNILKALEGVTHSSEASGLHPAGALARTHQKSNDAMTPVHNSLSLCENVHTHAKAWGLLSGT